MLEIIEDNYSLINKEITHKPKIPTVLSFGINSKKENMRNIYIQLEPEALVPIRDELLKFGDRFDYILTYDTFLIKKLPNAYALTYGTTWILPEDYENIDIKLKKFVLTSLTGCKVGAKGHRFRHKIYFHQKYIQNIPILFYLSGGLQTVPDYIPIINNNPYLSDKRSDKIELFKNAQFSLVIENSQQNNYFTEKICDCLITKTIPIYYGCPNISEFFDTTGWIIIENDCVIEFLQKLQILTPDYYMNHIDTVNKNFETVKKYIDYNENINRVLRTIPDY
jgi:hypothetical protein